MFMLLSQRPLAATPPDVALTITSRADAAERIVRNVDRDRNVLVLGSRGSGRSSLLSLVEHQLRLSDRGVRRVDAGPWSDTSAFLAVLSAALGQDPRRPATRTVNMVEEMSYPFVRRVEVPVGVTEVDARRVVDAAREAVGESGRHIVMLVDNLGVPVARDVFGRFRDTLWAAPLTWVAAGDRERDGYLDEPADAFWEHVEWLDGIDRGEIRELVQRRVAVAGRGDPDAKAFTKKLVEELAERLAGATPREVVRACAEIAEGGGPTVAFGAVDRLSRAQDAGGRSAGVLLAELERIGRPVHAGDRELLDRVGLTRPRVVQLLTALEKAGLVERHQEGRRVLYEAV